MRWASALSDAAAHLLAAFGGDTIERIVAQIPSSWLEADAQSGFADEAAHRNAYVDWLRARLVAVPLIFAEAERAHSLRV